MKSQSRLLSTYCICLLLVGAIFSCSGDSKARNEEVLKTLNDLQIQNDSLHAGNAGLFNEMSNRLVVNPKNLQIRIYYDYGVMTSHLAKTYRDQLEKMKVDLIAKVDDVEGSIAEERLKDPTKIKNKGNVINTDLFFNTPGPYNAADKAGGLKLLTIDLEEKFVELIDLVEAGFHDSILTSQEINETRNSLKLLDMPGEGKEWEKQHFSKKSQLSCIAEISQLQLNASKAEMAVLLYLSKKMDVAINGAVVE